MWGKTLLLLAGFACLAVRAAQNQPFLEQSFFFDWNIVGQPLPIPVTQQCETINITWERGSATGPNPTAPYFLQVYSSAYSVPFIIPAGNGLTFSWQVPFPPGSIYQICMFDINGATGGCQGLYTMVPSTNVSSTTGLPSCPNVTASGMLEVIGKVIDGPISTFGWPLQCTDISVLPRNGTPPYIFTIAPSLHPPHNITIQNQTATNWTIDLSWASPFFISVIDSVGNGWVNGPLHSGGPGSTHCLDTDAAVVSTAPTKSKTSPGPYIGAGLGGLAVGFLLFAGIFCLRRRRPNGQSGASNVYLDANKSVTPETPGFDRPGFVERPMSQTSLQYRPPPVPLSPSPLSEGSRNYQVEAFRMPGDSSAVTRATSADDHMAAQSSTSNNRGGADASSSGQVYVVHHDGGRAPVSVYTATGTEVVELPPRYAGGNRNNVHHEDPSDRMSNVPSDTVSEGFSEGRSDGGRSDRLSFLNPPRVPGQIKKFQEYNTTN